MANEMRVTCCADAITAREALLGGSFNFDQIIKTWSRPRILFTEENNFDLLVYF